MNFKKRQTDIICFPVRCFLSISCCMRIIEPSSLRCLCVMVWITLTTLLSFQAAYAQSAQSAQPAQSVQPAADEPFIPNLKDVDIHTLIETVATRTGRNFIVDPRVRATVTVITSEPVDADELYALFLSILDVHGLAAVPAGGFTKIVPATVGVQSSVPVVRSQPDASDELVTEVIAVRHVPAQQIVEALRALLPAYASFSAEPASNTLIITDRAANIARITEIIRSLDSLN